MSQQDNTDGDNPRLVASPEGSRRQDGAIELAIRLDNPHPTRALHYIADVRAIVVDPAGRFVVRLTDEGREVIPGAFQRDATIARIDPAATAILTVQVPDTIVRMRQGATPTTEVELERFVATDDQEIEIVIGWSDTPFYQDPRSTESRSLPTVTWETGQARVIVNADHD